MVAGQGEEDSFMIREQIAFLQKLLAHEMWQNLVFLSPSLHLCNLDFCLQKDSKIWPCDHWRESKAVFLWHSGNNNGLDSSRASKEKTPFVLIHWTKIILVP